MRTKKTLIKRTVNKVQKRALIMVIIFYIFVLEREPQLYVDVNLGNSGTQRIVVYEGDTAEALAEKFATEYNLEDSMKEKLVIMLQQQIAGVLEKIDEEQVSNNSDNNNHME